MPPDCDDPRAPGTIPKIVFLLPYALLERPDPRSASSSCAHARQLVRVAALPCRREHRKINFRQKNTYDLEGFLFVFLPDGAQRLIFTMNYHLRDEHIFLILTPNWPTPLLAPEGPVGSNWDPILFQLGSFLNPTG